MLRRGTRPCPGALCSLAVLWGPGTDNLIGLQDSTGTQYYVVQDQLGSVRGLVKRDGTWIMHQRFTPYGTLLARDSAGSSMPRGFHVGWTGREYDAETGFSFHRARYYSADLRRWTQEDPIGYAGGANLYAYVGGQVMEGRDPSGLKLDDPWDRVITASGNCINIDGSITQGCGAQNGSGGGGGGFSTGDYCLDLGCYLSGSELGVYLTTEMNADYDTYVANYKRLKEQYGGQYPFDEVFRGSTPLARGDYHTAVRAVTKLLFGANFGGAFTQTVVMAALGRLHGGYFFENAAFVAKAGPSARGRTIIGTPFSALHAERVFGPGAVPRSERDDFIGRTVLHELFHQWGFGEYAAYCMSEAITGYYRSSGCR